MLVFLEYSIRIFITLEAVLLALFAFLYRIHIKFQSEARKSDIDPMVKEYSFTVYDTGKACNSVKKIIIGTNILLTIDILVYLFYTLSYLHINSIVRVLIYLLNGLSLLGFALSISIICHNLASRVISEKPDL